MLIFITTSLYNGVFLLLLLLVHRQTGRRTGEERIETFVPACLLLFTQIKSVGTERSEEEEEEDDGHEKCMKPRTAMEPLEPLERCGAGLPCRGAPWRALAPRAR